MILIGILFWFCFNSRSLTISFLLLQNALYNHVVKQSQSLKRDLKKFAESPETAPLSLQGKYRQPSLLITINLKILTLNIPGQLSATLASFQRTLDDYAVAADQEIIPERKEQAKTRIEGFRSELSDIREEFRQLKLQREESVYNSGRAELLERRHLHGAHGSGEGEGPGGSQTPENPYSDFTRAEGLSREQDKLSRAGAQLDEFLERGRMVLGDLTEQKDILKSTQRRIYSVANTLGVSNETIRMVERRAKQDKRIFYGGILVMLVSFYYILKWFG